ncbi:TerD family protein [Nocardia acidivorans]|uniref:TerD family protein n=1 Tax=Nocardia acidivorans TaxID=404580 RepID=UPI0008322B6F|nr:TerD family protein [Nocardia acidivorans]
MSAALVKGQNGSLTVNDVVIGVQIAAPADLSALLVTETGKVRSDADFVFFNQPSGPGVNLQPGPSGQPAALVISLSAVPAGIHQIRAVITLDEAGDNFGRLPAPVATVSDLGGNPLYEYRIEGLDTESIVIALEVYRRQGGWKVRAVGQGYAGGFAALVTDHGVQVNQARSQPVEQAASAGAYPPPTGSAYPPAAPGYRPQTPAPVSDPSSDRDLPKNHSVSLTKGQRINLRKEGGVALSYMKMGLGWDPVKRGGMFGNRAPDIDLDASVVMFADTHPIDVVYYGSLAAKDGSIRHQGDNLTGEGEGDDEVIVVDLTRISHHVTTLVFIVTSYKGHTFEQVANAFCRLVDGTNNAELARFTLAGGMPFTGMAMAKVYRTGNNQDWKLEALGEGFQAKHPGEAVPQLGRFLH